MPTAAEDKNSYYYVNGQRVPLVQEPGVYSVKFIRGEKSDSPHLSRRCSRLLHEDSENIFFIPNYGIQVYRAVPQEVQSPEEKKRIVNELSTAVRELDHQTVVQYATPAYRHTADGGELMYATDRFVVKFKPEVTQQQIDELNTRYGVIQLEELGYCENGYLLQSPEGNGDRSAVALANIYYETGLCEFATPDFVRKTHFRNVASKPRLYELARDFGISSESLMEILREMHVDVKSHMSTVEDEVRVAVEEILRRDGHIAPSQVRLSGDATEPLMTTEREASERTQYLSEQWHLDIAKAIDAWNVAGRGNPSINVCIMDDGIDVDHAEFSGKVTRQYDFAERVDNARPKTAQDNHGTACAGVAVARGHMASGVAPACSLMAIRTPVYLGVADEAQMFRRAVEWGADVISCSWGPADGSGTVDPLPDSTRAAINYCVTSGRNGKGIPIFWAAGNGNESVSLDGYASNPDVIAVAASTSRETRASYSDFGPEIWVCAPSSGTRSFGERRIFTVDRSGSAGYNSGDPNLGDARGDYTNDFGGTSSATPLVAGIAGLILSVCPSLTHRQVRDIFKDTADKIGKSSSYGSNGHSSEYGYGRVNALAAVQMARSLAQAGSSTTPDPASGPSITCPASHPRTSAAPEFQINPGRNTYYAVEVATRAELFDQNAHGTERNSSNFYGSWEDTPLMTPTTYDLPSAVWERMKNADRLYLRIFTSSSPSDWVDYQVSTPDSQANRAPSMQITGNNASTATGANTSAATRMTITGPPSLNRSADPPAFQISTGRNAYYAVEVATRAELFDQNAHGTERSSSNFYGSWEDTPLMTATTYSLPSAVWERLRSANRLYYRIFTSARQTEWIDFEVSTADSQASSAPSIQLTGVAPRLAREDMQTPGNSLSDDTIKFDGNRTRRALHTQPGDNSSVPAPSNLPWITGPENYNRDDSAPSFFINPGANQYYGVEITSDPQLFLDYRSIKDRERMQGSFFASWEKGLMRANGETTFTLPAEAWQRLRTANRLFYRIITTSSPNQWIDLAYSTTDEDYAECSWINLRGSAESKKNLIPPDIELPSYTADRSTDERLWREQ